MFRRERPSGATAWEMPRDDRRTETHPISGAAGASNGPLAVAIQQPRASILELPLLLGLGAFDGAMRRGERGVQVGDARGARGLVRPQRVGELVGARDGRRRRPRHGLRRPRLLARLGGCLRLESRCEMRGRSIRTREESHAAKRTASASRSSSSRLSRLRPSKAARWRLPSSRWRFSKAWSRARFMRLRCARPFLSDREDIFGRAPSAPFSPPSSLSLSLALSLSLSASSSSSLTWRRRSRSAHQSVSASSAARRAASMASASARSARWELFDGL